MAYAGIPNSTVQPGSYLEWDGTTQSWFDFTSRVAFKDDFLGGNNSTQLGETNWLNTLTNTGTITTNDILDSGHPGIVSLGTGVLMGGASCLNKPLSIMIGGGVIALTYICKVQTLSNGTNNRYGIAVGLASTTSYSPTNGIFFQYSDNNNSGKWNCVCQTASTNITTVNTTNTVDTNWHKYTIAINAAATSVAFYIDLALVGTITTNIPTTAMGCSLAIQNLSTVFGTNANLSVDAAQFHQILTTGR